MPAPVLPPILTGLEPPGATEPMGQIVLGSGPHAIAFMRTFPTIEAMSADPEHPGWDPDYVEGVSQEPPTAAQLIAEKPVADVLEDVAQHPELREEVLAAENAKDHPRKGVLDGLADA